jgi:hypothetical protein
MPPTDRPIRPEAGANITLATKAKQVEAWLERLPPADPLASARMLAEYLTAHDRADLAAGFRGQLLDIVAVAVRRTLNALEREFRAMPLPMDARQLDHVDHALGLLAALADCNRRLAAEDAARSAPLFGERPLVGHVSRFLHVQREIMGFCHLSHRQLPERFWLDSHRVGILLFSAGLAQAADATRPATPLLANYLALLLEATADPYHLSEQERVWAIDIIARHGHLAVIEWARDAARGGVYGIRAGEDRPPYPLSWQQDMVPDCDLVLNTAPLVRKLALVVSQLERGRVPQHDIPQVRHAGYKALLQRLKLAWGASTQRTSARHPFQRSSECLVVIGLLPVHHYLSGAIEPAETRSLAGCQLLNESLGGIALQVERTTFRLKVGSLVCISRGESDERAEVGVVRWFKTAGNGALTFGVKYLPGRLRPCLCGQGEDSEAGPGLISEAEPGRPRHLVAAAGRIDHKAPVAIRQGEARFVVRLEGRREAQPEVEVFRCAVA